MARTVGRLAALDVRRLEKGKHSDGGGLYLVVTRQGTRNWAFRYMLAGAAHQIGLGAVHTVTLAEAREKARRHRGQLLDGIDPLAARTAKTVETLLFEAVADLYVTAHAAGWRSAKHEQQWRQSLRDHVLPLLGKIPVNAIDTGAVMRVLDALWRTKPETASRVRQRVENVLDYAAARGWREGANPARWKGHLANLLPAKSRVAPVQHHPAMVWSDVPQFMATLAERSGMAAKALAFTVLTATRSGETRGAVWGEFDLASAIWAIPASRMKAKQPHRLPLPPAALDMVRKLWTEETAPADLVFPTAAGKQLSDVALLDLLPSGVTVHGFRSTFRTWAGERTTFAREVIEMALAHRLGDAVEQAYARGDLFDRRRALMQAWADFCVHGEKAADDGKVTRLRQAAAVA